MKYTQMTLDELKAERVKVQEAMKTAEDKIALQEQEAAINEQIRKKELEQEQSERLQRSKQSIEVFVNVVQSIWDAILPEDTYETILGKTEYADKRQDFYKLVHAYHSEDMQATETYYEGLLQDRDEKFRKLTEQAMQTENQLTEARKAMEQAQRETIHINEKLNDEIQAAADSVRMLNETKTRLNEAQEIIEKGRSAELENVNLRLKIVEIEEKLNDLNKAKEIAKPSENLQNMIENIKNKTSKTNKTQLQAAIERWELPPIEMPKEEQFREQATETEPADNPISAPPEVTFRDDATVEVENSGAGDHTADAGTLAERVVELERKVEYIQRHLFSVEAPKTQAESIKESA